MPIRWAVACALFTGTRNVRDVVYGRQAPPFEPALTGSRAGEADRSHWDALLKGLPEGVALRPLSLEGVISHSSSAVRLEGVLSHSPLFLSPPRSLLPSLLLLDLQDNPHLGLYILGAPTTFALSCLALNLMHSVNASDSILHGVLI